MKKLKWILLFTLVIIVLFFIGSYHLKKNEATPIKNDKEFNIEESKKILNSSTIYFIGKWKTKYSDLVHYGYDEKGIPLIDLQRQLGSYTFSHIGETLILEEEYPVIESDFNGKNFSMKIDLKIVQLLVEGQLIDENTWKAVFEYYGTGGGLISKCNAHAARIR